MQDILKNTDRDLLIKDGDFEIGKSDQQHQEDLLLIDKGGLKQFPTVGVGAASYLEEEEDEPELLAEINKQFTGDGMEVNKIKMISVGNFDIDSKY